MMKTILCLFFFSGLLSLQAQDTLTIHLEVAEVTPTEKVYNFYFDNYDLIIGHQFALGYDTSGMTFRETRAYGSVHLGADDFNEPVPGEIRSVSINPTLIPENLDNPFMAFQLVFDVILPGGSDLCLTTNPFDYQFILTEGSQIEQYSHVQFYDDCHQPFVLGLQGTATHDPTEKILSEISRLHLGADGRLGFELAEARTARIQILDVGGQQIADLGEREMALGRQEFSIQRALLPGVYFISFITRENIRETVKYIVVE